VHDIESLEGVSDAGRGCTQPRKGCIGGGLTWRTQPLRTAAANIPTLVLSGRSRFRVEPHPDSKSPIGYAQTAVESPISG
jgi:hypothetical protein